MSQQSDKRRRVSRVTDALHVVDQARDCVELIDVATRRQDLHAREDLLSVATSLRLLVPHETSHVSESVLLHLAEVFGIAVRVAGFASNVRLPTVADARNLGSSSPEARVLESAARFFAWRSREDEYGDDLLRTAIDVSRVGGLLTPPCPPGREEAVLLRAAANLVAATRVAVALADPMAYEVWQEEHRVRRQGVVDELSRALATAGDDWPRNDLN